MNYSELTDFELNKLVAAKLFPDCEVTQNIDSESVQIVRNKVGNSFMKTPVDYCNNPSDAWPIIEKIWDELMREDCRGCGVTVWEDVMDRHKCSKLRAAMIVYLMMGDE